MEKTRSSETPDQRRISMQKSTKMVARVKHQIHNFFIRKHRDLWIISAQEEGQGVCQAGHLRWEQDHPPSQEPPPEDDEAPSSDLRSYSSHAAQVQHQNQSLILPHPQKHQRSPAADWGPRRGKICVRLWLVWSESNQGGRWGTAHRWHWSSSQCPNLVWWCLNLCFKTTDLPHGRCISNFASKPLKYKIFAGGDVTLQQIRFEHRKTRFKCGMRYFTACDFIESKYLL